MDGVAATENAEGARAAIHGAPLLAAAEPDERSSGADLGDDDLTLVRSLLRGRDDRAAHVLFDRYALLVRRILARTLGPFGDVEDHVQETFIVFFRQLRTLRDGDAIRAFVVSIAVRVARGELRRRRVRRILRLAPTGELPEEPVGGVLELEAREALRRFFATLDELDTPSRIAFTLRYLEEMELMEVALATGESLATVKRRLARVVPILNARLARDPAIAPYIRGVAS